MERQRLSSKRSKRKKGFQPLNLIPIMNLFITVIPMLLMIIVTVHMTLLSLNLMADAGGSGGGEGEGGGGSADDKIVIQLVIYPNRFELLEGKRDPFVIGTEEREDGKMRYNYFALFDALEESKERNPEVIIISVMPFNEVYYDTLVRSIDVCKHAGFIEIGYERPRVGAI